ncbi:YcxB family protein [Carnobacterium pleistocenium]|uniref:YcxB family protein n=1 Tax=Carnobacterium pleistocenium TaxID=181073 RepID=UPI000553CC9D|nr:YcxB family protein [Carnobacterium pleistocenium]
MEIEFELLEKDYINFNIDHTKKSPSLKRSINVQRLVGPIVFLIAPFIVIRFSAIPIWYWMAVFSIASLIWFVFYPRYFDWEMRKRIVKMLQEGNNENLLKKIKIVVTDKGISESSVTGELNSKWNEVNRVDETNEYIYIYNSSISAYIIPKRIFENENTLKIFLEEISKYTNV